MNPETPEPTPEPGYDQAVGMAIFDGTAKMFTRTIHQLPKVEADRLMRDLAAGHYLSLTVTFTKPIQLLITAVSPDDGTFRPVRHFVDPDVAFDFNLETWDPDDPTGGL